METQQQAARSWITDGIIIASITALAYLTSFAYEAGFCGFFKIPLHFISLSIPTILVTAWALVIIFITVFGIINMLYMIGIFDFSNPVSVSLSN